MTPTITNGAPEAWRGAIAALYLEAFRGKLGPVFGRDAAAAAWLAPCLDLSRCLVAVRDGQVVGVAGYCLDGRRLLRPLGWPALRRRHGLLRGTAMLLAQALLRRREAPDTLLMDGIVVAPTQRGQGIGRQLLAAMRALAGRHGRGAVRLDVVDSNPAARRLYLREGFVPVAEHRLGLAGAWLFGFRTATTMRIAALAGEAAAVDQPSIAPISSPSPNRPAETDTSGQYRRGAKPPAKANTMPMR